MQQMSDLGVNTIRIMASSEGAPTIQPYRMYPALMTSPYEWNEDIFVGLDRCLAKMESLGQKAIMSKAHLLCTFFLYYFIRGLTVSLTTQHLLTLGHGAVALGNMSAGPLLTTAPSLTHLAGILL